MLIRSKTIQKIVYISGMSLLMTGSNIRDYTADDLSLRIYVYLIHILIITIYKYNNLY